MAKDIGKDGEGLQEVRKDDFLNRMPNHNYFAKDLNLRYIASECSDSTAMYAGVDSPKQLQGKSDYDLIWATSAESFVITDRQALANQPQINHKETVLVQNGFHDFLITKVKMYNRREEVVGVVGLNICVDNFTISERKGKLDIEQKRLNLGKAFHNQNLTRRQTQVFIGIIKGHSALEIAYTLKLRLRTITTIITELQSILQCTSRAEIVLVAVKNGWHFLISDNLIYKKN